MSSTDEPTVHLERDGGILTVTFDREQKRNAVDDAMIDALRDAADQLSADPTARALIITARGTYFSAGIDLHNRWSRSLFDLGPDHPDLVFRHRYRQLHRLFDEFEAIEKPIILGAQGPCLGVGVEMSASCDFRFASENATFSVPEVRMGSIAGSGGVSRLTRVIGPHWTKWLSMAGQTVDAEQALRIGLVHEVVPAQSFESRLRSFAAELASLPAEAVGLTKLLTDAAVDTDRVAARHLDRIAVTT
ncbi:MAG: enoyl-CoA hydratase/isomerase family protein, partial [Phycisphaerales bacterium JB060]